MAVITADHISKHFRRSTKSKLLREHMAAAFSKDEDDDEERFYALRDVSFQLEPGQALGVIGRNGAGKSTLLNVVTGISLPDSGTLEVNGKVAALLELGSGFHPDLTGLENLRLNASLLGFTRQDTKRLEKEIVEFAELEDFILEPLRTYSSGMLIRLAFAIAVNLDPDLLIIDEVLAVGDAPFQIKCLDRIRSRRKAGKSLICVSHATALLIEFCDTAIWLDQGHVMRQGAVKDVMNAYLEFCQLAPIPVEPPAQMRLQKVHRN